MAAIGRLPAGRPAVTVGSTSRGRDLEFERIFDEFSAPIYNYALRMVGDPDRAADIAQDTFIKAYRKLDSLTDDTSIRSWIYRIATNTAIDEMRRRRFVMTQTALGPDGGRILDRADRTPNPEAQVMAGTLDERVQRALLRLKPNHRQCLLLSDLEDMSAQQIGEVMGMSYGAVRTLLCRARGEMRRALSAEGFAR